MYIEPNTLLRVLCDVPLDIKYEHTINFKSKEEQTDYFVSKTYRLFPNHTFQRAESGVVKVKANAEQLYGCNYIMFQNSNFGTKWFYGFITGVDYISNEVTKIEYTIDVMQTWAFDYTLTECYVEREHVLDDTIGANIIDEGIDFGGHVMLSQSTHFYNDWSVVIQYAPKTLAWLMEKITTIPDTKGGWYNGLYSGCGYYRFLATQTDEINTQINELLSTGYDIVNIYMCPNEFFGDEEQPSVLSVSNTRPNSYGGYTPKNNKLLCFPYTYLKVSNNMGVSCDFEFERMENGRLALVQYVNYINKAEVMYVPLRYDGVDKNYAHCISITDFPVCCWQENGFLSYLGSGAIANAVGGSFVDKEYGNTRAEYNEKINKDSLTDLRKINTVSNVMNTFTKVASQPTIQGNVGSGYVQSAKRIQGLVFQTVGIKDEYAKMLDDFFTKYGYKVNTIKKPNISGRPYWNYCKTIGCTVVGKLPADDMSKICEIFDNGITFWHNPNVVGNYSLNNK